MAPTPLPQHVNTVRICVVAETVPREHRVALVPDSVAALVKAGHEVVVQSGAGTAAYHDDASYVVAGATIAGDAAVAHAAATVVCRVQRPSDAEVVLIPEGATLISLMAPASAGPIVDALTARRVSVLALELVPRITRAQSMDVLSSQATVAGYKAVLIGASMLPRFLPMLTTAAGSITPAKTFVIGAGVAGLQALATARRLGAVTSGFDVRAAAAEQVKSLGATFVQSDVVSAAAEGTGGYAKAQSDDEAAQTLATIAKHIKQQDLVITTAAIPGRTAPRLITAEMVRSMRPGSVIIDLAAETGGNCELTRLGETVAVNGVMVVGASNLPATMPTHASQMFSRNVLTLLQHLTKDGTLLVDLSDEITGAMTLTHDGQVRR